MAPLPDKKTTVLQGKMVCPERFELPTFWFVGFESKILNALFVIASGCRHCKM